MGLFSSAPKFPKSELKAYKDSIWDTVKINEEAKTSWDAYLRKQESLVTANFAYTSTLQAASLATQVFALRKANEDRKNIEREREELLKGMQSKYGIEFVNVAPAQRNALREMRMSKAPRE